MSQVESNARAYCLSLGLAPEAMVWGYLDHIRFKQPRWRWYVGARL